MAAIQPLRVGLVTVDNSPINFATLVPNQAQLALGPNVEYFDANAATRLLYMITKAGTGFASVGAGGAGSSTLASMTDMGTYDLATNNPSVAAVKAAATAALPAAQKAAVNGVGSLDAGGHQPVTQLGTGVPGAQATGHVFANTDNTANVLASGTPNYVLNTGLMPGWGVSIKGAFTLSGSATTTDLRSTTGVAICSLMQTAADGSAYDLVGTK